MKKILSVFLCLIIICSIFIHCTLESSAVFGIDDALLIGTVVLDLASLGVTIYGVSNFCKSDTFKDFCTFLGNDIDNGISLVKRNGTLFFATAKIAWDQLTSWVKSHFSGRNETKEIEFDATVSSNPQNITLRDGTTVPYASFMDNPFVIYKLKNGSISGVYCTGVDVGVNITSTAYRVWCTGHGECYKYDLVNGNWGDGTVYSMNYGLTYKGVKGSFCDFSLGTGNYTSTATQYRTMPRVTDSGADNENGSINENPSIETEGTATVTATSDSMYYPGAVNAVAEVIQEGDQVLIAVPEEMVVDYGTANPTLTTDVNTVANTMSGVTPSSVDPKILSSSSSQSVSVEQVITDTPTLELDSTNSGNAESDITTANKFRLPRSFLEGFPFSIPYSVYVGIQSLIADPEAPVFNIPFSVPRLGITENMEIDLTKWDPVAHLCRALLSIVWIAGLAMACSKFLKR